MVLTTVVAKEESLLKRKSKTGDQDAKKSEMSVKGNPFMSARESISGEEVRSP